MAKKAAKKSTKKKAKKKAAKKPNEMLLVGSKVKNVLRDQGVNVSSDAPEALNDVVYWYCQQAVRRAEANGRKTVRKHDFMA